MRIEATPLLPVMTSLLQDTRLGSHLARLKSVTGFVSGLLATEEASLSGAARGQVLLSETEDHFRAKLKQAYELIRNEHFDAWEVSRALYDLLTRRLRQVVIAVDWTQVGQYMMLEASLVVDGRAIPFYGRSVLKAEIQGRQRVLEQSLEYALESFRRPDQEVYEVVDRGFAALDYLGPSSLFPHLHRITRLTKHMILTWDELSAPLREWPLFPGESVAIERACLGRKKPIRCAVVLAHVGQECYLAGDASSTAVALEYYRQRPWIENQNRDLKTGFGVYKTRFLNALRLDRMWSLLGVTFALIYTQSRHLTDWQDRLSRRYTDGRQDLSWLSLAHYVHRFQPLTPALEPLG